jgi:gliding motility-associated-like protein
VVLSNASGCTTTYVFTVSETALPNAALPAVVELCEGQSEVLSPGIAENYAWSNGTEASTLLVDTPGDYSAVLSNGECAVEVSTEVVVAELPEFDFPDTFELCEDSVLVQTLPNLPYTFTLGGEELLDSVRVESAGSYLLVALDPGSGCTTSRTFQVNGLMPPRATLPESITLCEQSSIVLDPGNEATGTLTLWNTGDETSLLTVFESGLYSVELENTCGTASAFTEVEVVACDCPVFVPNAFTPDLDDLNEVFFPVIACDVTDYRFSIFDRWGSLLFYSETPGEGWNGEGPSGTHYVQGEAYVWQLQFRADLPGNAIVVDRVGHVMVLR